jgi:outer membrane lipoprotein carrier protein
MKKQLCLLLLLSNLWAFQQSDNQAAMLKLLQSLNTMDAFQANFLYTSQEANNPQEELLESIKGTIYTQGVKYHLVLEGQEIICNGQVIWNYLPQVKEVQITEYDPEQEGLDPIKLLTLDRTGFIPISLNTKAIDGRSCDVIELAAAEPEAWIRKLTLAIDQQGKKIKYLEALDAEQCYHCFQIIEFDATKELPDSYFEFDLDQHPEIEVIDLR